MYALQYLHVLCDKLKWNFVGFQRALSEQMRVILFLYWFFSGGRKRGMKLECLKLIRMMNLDNRVKRIDPPLLPTAEEAVKVYPGTISSPCGFVSVSKKNIRFESFHSRYSFQTLFSEVSDSSFAKALLFLIDITYRLHNFIFVASAYLQKYVIINEIDPLLFLPVLIIIM